MKALERHMAEEKMRVDGKRKGDGGGGPGERGWSAGHMKRLPEISIDVTVQSMLRQQAKK